jgi:hypothetical protein
MAYKHQANSELHGTSGDPTWRMVWKWEGPERIISLKLLAYEKLKSDPVYYKKLKKNLEINLKQFKFS